MAAKREQLVIKARLSQSAGRFEEMLNDVRDIVTALPKKQALNEDERGLLAIAFKNEVGIRRKGLKTLQKIITTTRLVNPDKTKAFYEFKDTVSRELKDICQDLIWMIDSKLLLGVKSPEEDVFYHKLKGDYFRYLAENEEEPSKAAEHTDKAREVYEAATEVSQKNLAATHPLRIGLAMNYSVFIQERLGDIEKAHAHATRFYDDALDELEEVKDVDEERYNECAFLLKLMHENIKTWALELDIDQVGPTRAFNY